jgi:hypothetical protein
MEQTFNDLCRERLAEDRPVHAFAAGLFAEALAGILKQRIALMMPSRNNVIRLLAITLAILAVPFVAMRFTGEVDWSAFDFLFAGALIFGTGMAFLAIAHRARNSAYRMATALGLLTCFLIVWITGAVGIIGSEDNPANLLYFLVLLVPLAGAILARLRPGGMARTMFVTGVVHFLVPFAALLIWQPVTQGNEAIADLIRVFFLNAVLALMFVASGILYRQAGDHSSTGLPGLPATSN